MIIDIKGTEQLPNELRDLWNEMQSCTVTTVHYNLTTTLPDGRWIETRVESYNPKHFYDKPIIEILVRGMENRHKQTLFWKFFRQDDVSCKRIVWSKHQSKSYITVPQNIFDDHCVQLLQKWRQKMFKTITFETVICP